MTDAKLKIKDLYFYYDGKKSLDNINISFQKNKITALIGSSGSGKSTLLRSINRIFNLYPNQTAEGQILLDGENILDKNTNLFQLRKRVGMVFQSPTLFPMSIYQNIAFAVKIHEKINKKELQLRVEWALKSAALWNEVEAHLHDAEPGLSGGQQQRLCLARALAVQPEVLLLDEPCSALDPISTQKIERTLEFLRPRHTILLVTHDLQQAKRLSDEVVFLSQGMIVESGKSSSFFEDPQDARSRDYLASEHH